MKKHFLLIIIAAALLTPAIAQQSIEVSHPAFHEVIIEDVSEEEINVSKSNATLEDVKHYMAFEIDSKSLDSVNINISLNKSWVENNGFKVDDFGIADSNGLLRRYYYYESEAIPVTVPATYFLINDSTAFLARDTVSGDCGLFVVEKPSLERTERCSWIPHKLIANYGLYIGLLASAIFILVLYRLFISHVENRLSELSFEVNTQGHNLSTFNDEELQTLYQSNQNASQGNYLKAYKLLKKYDKQEKERESREFNF